jgi:oxygen-independent coproporphyrinogen-3 oxidase
MLFNGEIFNYDTSAYSSDIEYLCNLFSSYSFGGVEMFSALFLPHMQTWDGFNKTIEKTLSLQPDRISLYSYAHVPWMKSHQKRIDEGALPRAWDRFTLFRDAVRRFTESDYRWIGIDHFARPDDSLALAADAGRLHRNFMGYTTRSGENLLGIGVSSISEVDGWFAQNAADLGPWQREIDARHLPITRGHVMSDDDMQRGDAVAHLMCNAELPYDMFAGDISTLVDTYEQFANDGLILFESDRISVTPLGRFFLRNLAFPLDAYRGAADSPRRFSRAV